MLAATFQMALNLLVLQRGFRLRPGAGVPGTGVPGTQLHGTQGGASVA